jgi:hypothetical protein
MIRGSVVKLKGKRGRPRCASAHDPEREHIRYYLSSNDGGRAQMAYIPKRPLPEVEEEIRGWKAFKKTAKELAEANLAKILGEKTR